MSKFSGYVAGGMSVGVSYFDRSYSDLLIQRAAEVVLPVNGPQSLNVRQVAWYGAAIFITGVLSGGIFDGSVWIYGIYGHSGSSGCIQ